MDSDSDKRDADVWNPGGFLRFGPGVHSGGAPPDEYQTVCFI